MYLPSYDDNRIIKILKECANTKWEVFSKHNKKPIAEKNINIRPISNDAFVKSMASSEGVLCGAGFETPAEALFLKKKLLVIPMKGQFEQQCNAAALKEMGVPVIKSLKKKHLSKIKEWIKLGKVIGVDYPDITEEIVQKILTEPAPVNGREAIQPGRRVYSLKKFKQVTLKKIVPHL